MNLSAEEIIASLHYQVAALEGMALGQGLALSYVKPHGALYNDMMAKPEVRAAIMQALADYHRPLPLMLQASPAAAQHRSEAAALGIRVMFEAFADRCYDDDGSLLSRRRPGAVHTRERMLAQVEQLQQRSTVTTVGGAQLPLQADTLCVHGDNPEGVQAIQAIRALVRGQLIHRGIACGGRKRPDTVSGPRNQPRDCGAGTGRGHRDRGRAGRGPDRPGTVLRVDPGSSTTL